MKIAIMQPYLFPYIGYWQLINAVDGFVVYDDVNFIKGGWINRNFILHENKASLMTFDMSMSSSYKKINEIKLLDNSIKKKKLLKKIQYAYSKAPFYNNVYPLVESAVLSKKENLSQMLYDSMLAIVNYLNIDTNIILSSDLEKNNRLKGSEKVIDIIKRQGAKTYINAIGGKTLYSKECFAQNGIDLFFLETKNIEYEQFTDDFVPNLSVIDVMMFNSQVQIREMLNEYTLV